MRSPLRRLRRPFPRPAGAVTEPRVPFRMERVRIGCVKYLNTLPLIEGLASWRDAEIISAVPSRLIDMLLSALNLV